jgi:hypothetical protein
MTHAEQTKPAELEGFVFYQGRDGSEETDKQHAGADLAQLAKLTQGEQLYCLHAMQCGAGAVVFDLMSTCCVARVKLAHTAYADALAEAFTPCLQGHQTMS